MNPAYHIYEQIDRYLKDEMDESELAEFNSRIAIDDELHELIEAQKIANSVIIDDQLVKLKKRIATDLDNGRGNVSSTNWPKVIGIVSIVIFSAGIVIYKLKDSSSSNSNVIDSNKLVVKDRPETERKNISETSVSVSHGGILSVNKKTTKPSNNLSSSNSPELPVDKKEVALVEKSIDDNLYQGKVEIGLTNNSQDTERGKKVNDCASVKISAETKVYYESSSNEATIVINKLSLKGGTEPYSYALDEDDFTSKNIFNYIKDGKYVVRIKDANNCISILPEKVVVKIPAKEIDDAFTPSYGEKWKFPIKKESNGNISIFSKSGSEVFKVTFSGGYPEEWDGSSNTGVVLESGNYYFVIQYSDGESLKGHVSILR